MPRDIPSIEETPLSSGHERRAFSKSYVVPFAYSLFDYGDQKRKIVDSFFGGFYRIFSQSVNTDRVDQSRNLYVGERDTFVGVKKGVLMLATVEMSYHDSDYILYVCIASSPAKVKDIGERLEKDFEMKSCHPFRNLSDTLDYPDR